MSQKNKWIIGVLIVVAVIIYSGMNYFHMIQNGDDKLVEAKSIESLKANAEIDFSRIIPGQWEYFCIVPSYSYQQYPVAIDKESKDYIDLRINNYLLNNVGDTVWWIFTVKNKKVENLFRMSQKIKPVYNTNDAYAIKKTTCFSREDSLFYEGNNEYLYVFSKRRNVTYDSK